MKLIINLLLLLCCSVAFADQICGKRIYLNIMPESQTCGDTPPAYTPESGCSVATAEMVGCVSQYTICCDTATSGSGKRYGDSLAQVYTLQSIPVGSEYEAATNFYEETKNGLGAPACVSGYRNTSEMKGFVYDIQPNQDYTKSDVRITMWNRIGCEAFSNSTSVPIGPIGGGSGGSGGGSVSVDMTATNDILNQIKAAVDAVKTSSDAGQSQGVIDAVNNIKALLEVGGVANPNALLTSIKGVLDGMDVKDVERNGLLVQIRDAIISGGGGSGGTVNVDMTETNGLLGDISAKFDSLLAAVTGFFDTGGDTGSVDAPSVSGLPTVSEMGDPADSVNGIRAQLEQNFEYKGKKTALDIFKAHEATWQASNAPLYAFINNLKVSAVEALPSWTLDLPRWGVHWTFDLADSKWAYVFGVVRTLVIMSCLLWAYSIVFRAR